MRRNNGSKRLKAVPLNFAICISIVVCISAATVIADVAPDAGQKRVYFDLVMNADENFEDFRFFVVSGNKVVECPVKKGLNDAIGPMGGGAFYRSARVYAVPRNRSNDMSDLSSPEGVESLRSALTEGRIPGAVKLIDHSFTQDVAEDEAGDLQQPVYRIVRDQGGAIRAVAADSISPASGESRQNETQEAGATRAIVSPPVIVGSIAALAAVFTGLWFIRKRASRS